MTPGLRNEPTMRWETGKYRRFTWQMSVQPVSSSPTRTSVVRAPAYGIG